MTVNVTSPEDRKDLELKVATPAVEVFAVAEPETIPENIPVTVAPETGTPVNVVMVAAARTDLEPFRFSDWVSTRLLTFIMIAGVAVTTSVICSVSVAPRESVTVRMAV